MPSVNYTPYGNLGSDLGNLGSLLFPDASKVMEGRYYGAKSREAQINTLKGQAELNERPYIMGMTPGSGVQQAPAQYYHPPGSNPNDPPIIAPSSGITMQDGSSPPLSQTVTTPAPGPVPGTPAIPPAQVADLADQAGVHTGAPPASSSPAPNSGAPPAQTTTASNGTTPSNDALSATIHPGTFWSADGGRKMAPPAQANGSPAPLAFNPNLYMAHMLAAGYTAQQAQAGLASYILQFKNDHVIDEPTADYAMSAAGNATPMTEAGATTRTGMTNATNLAQENIRQAGETGRTNLTIAASKAAAGALPFKYQPGGPGTAVLTTTTEDATARHLQPYDEAADVAARGLINVQTNGPASPPTAMRQGEVPTGTPVFNQNVYDTATKPISVVDTATKQPATIRYQDYLDAPPGKYIYNPASKEISPKEALDRKTVYNKVVQDAFPGIPQSRASQLGYAQRNEKAVLNPADDVTYTERANNLYTYGPVGVRGDPYAAGQMALKQLQQEGIIRKSVDREAHTDIYNPHIVEYQTEKGPVQYFRIPSLQEEAEPLKNTVAPTTSAPATSAPAATPAAPASSGASENPGFLSTLFTNPFNFKGTGGASAPTAAAPAPTPQAAGAMPAGALMAVPNAVENQTGTTRDGTRFVVHGGYAFPVASPQLGR